MDNIGESQNIQAYIYDFGNCHIFLKFNFKTRFQLFIIV